MRIDLNCDLGEATGAGAVEHDRRMMAYVTSVNVACGAHAGDPDTMRATVRSARAAGACVGAHPGFADREGFGRRDVELTSDEIENLVLTQIGALAAIARAESLTLSHVKPHGALYNMAGRDRRVADAIARAVALFDSALPLVALSGSVLLDAGRDAGLDVVPEVFADRAFDADGALVSRRRPGAVIHEPERMIERAVRMVRDGSVEAIDGTQLALTGETICVHGDTPGAAELAMTLRRGLEAVGVAVEPMRAARQESAPQNATK